MSVAVIRNKNVIPFSDWSLNVTGLNKIIATPNATAMGCKYRP
jgi:hypothetical protein